MILLKYVYNIAPRGKKYSLERTNTVRR